MNTQDQANETVTPARKAPRWMKIVLILSLMLNVAGIGAVGARFWAIHKHGYGPGFGYMGAMGMHSFLRRLPHDRREELRARAFKLRSEMRANGRSMLAPLKDFATALVAEDYDRARVEAALRSFRESSELRVISRERYILDFIDALEPEERQDFGRNILARTERHEYKQRRLRR